ncbi:MAG: phosphoribosylamine--glycine ligase [Hyphomicrobiaceae bacterium]|jgi:phosphoribosylamine--glycine ligase
MRVLVVGSGGREHALAWKIASDPRVTEVLAAPGSPGMETVATSTGLRPDDLEGLANFACEQAIDLTVVGPEGPLAAGIVDIFHARGLRIFGPDRAGAQLEASKAFTKQVLVDAGVPTAAYGEFTEVNAAIAFARELGPRVVVKADGLAAGKGVVLCTEYDQAEAAIRDMLEDNAFGDAGSRVVVEEFLDGEEASFMALTDGKSVLALATSQDHKAVFDGDKGPNTGGMGAYSPAPVVSTAQSEEIVRTVIEPTVRILAARGIDFRGVLYAGLMMTADGPKVLEYNVRFGDPECQPIMMRLESSLVDLMEATIDGRLSEVEARWHPGAAVCVVMAAENYPGAPVRGDVISGIEDAETDADVMVFHGGTKKDDQGRWTSAGGRVLGVTARAGSVGDAAARAYKAVKRISWRGTHYRQDIAWRAIDRSS